MITRALARLSQAEPRERHEGFSECPCRCPDRHGQSDLKQLGIPGVLRERVRVRAVPHLKHNHQAATQCGSFHSRLQQFADFVFPVLTQDDQRI
jgi:hypothetical protein